MHDGVLKTLANVWHVPYLKKKFISLSELDSNECKVTIENEFLRIVKGALVVMKARNAGNLYVLLGNTIYRRSSCVFYNESCFSFLKNCSICEWVT